MYLSKEFRAIWTLIGMWLIVQAQGSLPKGMGEELSVQGLGFRV